jgi:hypothetical protein
VAIAERIRDKLAAGHDDARRAAPRIVMQ